MIDIPPFSILDTRSKKWKDNTKYWINKYNIKPKVGKAGIKSKSGFWETPNYVSTFSPTLCHLMFQWFVPPKGKILDPFVGGPVSGIVATEMGFDYTGIDLSENQVKSNRLQSTKPNWIAGDANTVLSKLDTDFDFVFTCPPYHDLEVYSNHPDDISSMDYDEFLSSLMGILSQSVQRLKDNRFVGIMVSEIRDTGSTRNYKIGKYKNFVADVINMCEDIGLSFYNDMILYNSQHQASRTAGVYFKRNRKVASVHQNILIFIKGNPDLATEDIDWGGCYSCLINGTKYKSFRGAAISIDPIELVGSEVKRRCESTKSKYKNWQIIGAETRPLLKYEIDGIPFESPNQIASLLGGGITETNVRTYISSKQPLYRHWIRINSNQYNISYEEMDKLHQNNIPRITLPVIKCNGIEFYSQEEAGLYFGVSRERIRQKLKDDKWPEFVYL